MAGMDLSEIRKRTLGEAWLNIIHPITGQETDMRICVMSPDSQKYREIDQRIKNSGLQATRRTGTLSMQEIDSRTMELLVSATVGWENVIFDGQPLEFTPVNVEKVYTDFPFIKDQVDRFIADRQNFFTA